MGGLFSSSALDKKSLDAVQHQLLENGLDMGEIQECSLMDNERGGTFYLRFAAGDETVLRVWDRHCSWWAFEFDQQSEREVWALRLAEAAGVPVPTVMATGKMEQAGRQCSWALLRYVKDVREDDWDDDQPARVPALLVEPMVKLQRSGPLTQDILQDCGILRPGQSLADCPLPCMPTHKEVIEYLRQCAAKAGEEDVKEAVEKVASMFSDISPLAPCLVHSDLHPGNLLVDQAFQTRAVIDWEEAAISDPRIDVAQASLVCDEQDAVWALYAEQTGLELGPRAPWTALVALMRYMVRVLIDWYEKTGKEVPEKNLSGWESLCGDAEEILIHLDILPNPSGAKSKA